MNYVEDEWVCPEEATHDAITAAQEKYESRRDPDKDAETGPGRGGRREGSGRQQEAHFCPVCERNGETVEMVRVKSTRGYNFKCPNVENHPTRWRR